MTFALVEDVEKRLWVVESCPAGTQFWTVAQASVPGSSESASTL